MRGLGQGFVRGKERLRNDSKGKIGEIRVENMLEMGKKVVEN